MKKLIPLSGTQSRREFLQQCGSLAALAIPMHADQKINKMNRKKYDVIIIGGSYAGLSAAMALGRALRQVLVIDGGKPANRFAPHSHNFITHDGRPPGDIAALAKDQVRHYRTVDFIEGFASQVEKRDDEFFVTLQSGGKYCSNKIILATGIIDVMTAIPGFAECWGKSVLHCPYCHGYEVRNLPTGILGNGDYAFEFGALISNWTTELTIYTNGPCTFTAAQRDLLGRRHIMIVEKPIAEFSHFEGKVDHVILKDGHALKLQTVYARPHFIQHSTIAEQLNCELTPDGYIKVDHAQKTSIAGVFAIGDCTSKMRTVSNAVASGTVAGMTVNKELTLEKFLIEP